MTTIAIGGIERDLSSASTTWVRDQVRALTSRGLPVCVKVSIHFGAVNMLLSTPACNNSASESRVPNGEEERILDLWHQRGMNGIDFEIDQLVAFLNEIKVV